MTTMVNGSKVDDCHNSGALNEATVTRYRVEMVLFSAYTMTLYMVRQVNSSSSWKIQALFDHNIKYVFEDIGPLTRPGVSLLRSCYKITRIKIPLEHI